MKQSNASKTLLVVVTILTVMMALIVPSPAYAAKEPPPPPPPPSNDRGPKVSGPSSHSSAKDIPNGTNLVVTDNGTPVSLAAQLTVDALNGPGSANASTTYVKFCATGVEVTGACKNYHSVQAAIDDLAKKSDGSASGTFFVDFGYKTDPLTKVGPGILDYAITQTLPINLDQSKFSVPNIAGMLDLNVLGGYNFTTGDQGNQTTLVQTFNIKNFNDLSSVNLDNFIFNIGPLASGDAVSVSNSNAVTLSRLTVNDTNVIGNGIGIYDSNGVKVLHSTVNDSNLAGSGIYIDNSNDVTVGGLNTDKVTVNRSGGLYGDGITIKDSGAPAADAFALGVPAAGSIALENVTINNTNLLLGDGLHITGSQNISMDNVSATSKNMYGAYLEGNSEGLAINNSTFSNSGFAGLYVLLQNGEVSLENVTADNNGSSLLALTPGLASGASFVDNSGVLNIDTSEFDSNAAEGLWILNQTAGAPAPDDALNESGADSAISGDVISIYDSEFDENSGDGLIALTPLLAGDISVSDSEFTANDGNGLTALSLGSIYLEDSGFTGNGGDGAFATSLFGNIGVDPSIFAGNTGNGLTAQALVGDIILEDSAFYSNGGDGASATAALGSIGVDESFFAGNHGNGLVANTLVGDVVLYDMAADQNGDNGIVATALLGNIQAQDVYADQNDVIGALLTSLTGEVGVEDSGFDNNGGVGLVAFGLQDVFMGWSEASGNQYAGATLASLGDVVVTNSNFFGESDYYLPQYAPQLLGLGVVAGDVVLDSSQYLPANDFAQSQDVTDFGVNASGNGGMGALILSASDIQIGDSIFDENGASVANLGLLSLLGDGVVAVGGLGGDGATEMFNTEANGNTAFGAVLFNTDFVGAFDSTFDTNGVGGLLGLSFGDVFLDNVDASANSLIGAATLSGGSTSVSDSIFDSNLAGAGLLSVAFGTIWAEDVDASNNGILGAGLVSIDTDDLTGFPASDPCSDIGFSGDICVNRMTANDNGFIGAAILGTDWVEVDNSQFTGNDSLGSLLGVIPGGGLVVVGGESTVLDHVQADKNLGFGAVVGNTGGVSDLLAGMLGSSNSAAGAINQAVTGSATSFDLSGLPIFTDVSDISITNSSFSHNDAFGLMSVSDGDIYLRNVAANDNGTSGASLFAEGNITVKHSTFNDNGTFGLAAEIFTSDTATLTEPTTHKVILNSVEASNNGDFGAAVQANTLDPVDVSVTWSEFDHNHGAGTGGLGIFTTGDVFLSQVSADYNAGDGADIFGDYVTIKNSHMNFNDGFGLVVNSLAHTHITDTNVCWNKLGPDVISAASLFTNNFTTSCEKGGGGGGPTEENPLPWQIINVMTDPGKNSGTLSCTFGTTFLYLEKQTPPTLDFEWARAVLSACIVPGGSVGTFLGLAEGALPGPLPSGITFQGKAFDLAITGPNGQPVDLLGGPMMVRFTLPDGFTLPSGKKLDILWWDPAGKKWVELNTYTGGKYAWGFAGNDGTFALTIK